MSNAFYRSEVMFYNVINRVLFAIISVLLPIIILLSCVEIVAYDMDYYKSQYDKHNISKNIEIEESELLKSTEKLLDYIKGKRNNLDFKVEIKRETVEFFSERDKLHMIDVKNLFQIGNILRNGLALLIGFIIVLLKFNKNLKIDTGKCLLFSSIIGIMPFLILIILINIDFNRYFTIFHEIFFSNDLWLLDPGTDRLVNIFPEEFFAYTAMRILIFYFAIQLVFIIIGFFKIYEDKNVKQN